MITKGKVLQHSRLDASSFVSVKLKAKQKRYFKGVSIKILGTEVFRDALEALAFFTLYNNKDEVAVASLFDDFW